MQTGGDTTGSINNRAKKKKSRTPRDELDEGRVEHDSGLSIEDGRAGIVVEVRADDLIRSEAEDALELALRGGLDGLLDLVVGGGLGELDSQVNNGDVQSRHTESHAGELALEGRNDLSNGLGCTSRGRDDVARSGTSTTPVLATLRGAINRQLSGSSGMDGGHETLDDAPVLVHDHSQRGQAVSGARSVRDNLHLGLVLLLLICNRNAEIVWIRTRQEPPREQRCHQKHSTTPPTTKHTRNTSEGMQAKPTPREGNQRQKGGRT